jgi:class 3 adenylate cyclase
MDYTALGDTVNLAARLQDIARGNQILVSDTTHAVLGADIAVNSMGPLNIRNRSKPVTTYAVIGPAKSRT